MLQMVRGLVRVWHQRDVTSIMKHEIVAISYPESSGSLVSGLVARDSGEMEFFPQKSGVPFVVRMLSFIKNGSERK